LEDNLMAYVENISALTDEYTFWCKAQGLKCVDAMELIHESELNRHQNAWVVKFIERWEAAWDREIKAEEADLQACWHREGGE
jgi:hypothetical protein